MVLSALSTFEDSPLVCGCSHSLQGLALYATMSLHFITCPTPLLRVSYFFLMGMHRFGPSAALSQSSRVVWLTPVEVGLLCALVSSLSLTLLPASHCIEQLLGSLAAFHIPCRSRPQELCTTSRSVLLWTWLCVETSFWFILFFPFAGK